MGAAFNGGVLIVCDEENRYMAGVGSSVTISSAQRSPSH